MNLVRTISQAEQLADYAVGLSLDAVPEAVRQKAKLCILDTVGCMIAGSATRVGQVVRAYAGRGATGGDCTIAGSGAPAALEFAALANGTMAHVLELDDGHRPSDNHLGCVVVPAAIAAAEDAGASGAALLKAVIAGYDIMGRVGQATCLPRMMTAFHGTATTGGFGAATAAGILFELSAAELACALGIAGTGGAGLREAFVSGADCKSFQVGRSVWNGINAALLARLGLEGPRDIFEGKYGFVNSQTPIPRHALIVADLGTRFAVAESAFKIHAACGILFTAIDAALELRSTHRVDADRIERIRVALPDWVRDDPVFARRRPQTAGQARFSIPFTLAAALRYGEVSPRQLSAAAIADPHIADLEQRIEVVEDPRVEELFHATKEDDFFFYPSAVTLTVDGQDIYKFESSPRGYDRRRPLSAEDVIRKFVGNAADVVGSDAAGRAVDTILDLESIAQVDMSAVLGVRQ